MALGMAACWAAPRAAAATCSCTLRLDRPGLRTVLWRQHGVLRRGDAACGRGQHPAHLQHLAARCRRAGLAVAGRADALVQRAGHRHVHGPAWRSSYRTRRPRRISPAICWSCSPRYCWHSTSHWRAAGAGRHQPRADTRRAAVRRHRLRGRRSTATRASQLAVLVLMAGLVPPAGFILIQRRPRNIGAAEVGLLLLLGIVLGPLWVWLLLDEAPLHGDARRCDRADGDVCPRSAGVDTAVVDSATMTPGDWPALSPRIGDPSHGSTDPPPPSIAFPSSRGGESFRALEIRTARLCLRPPLDGE